jgi:AcrR family transcriptional regulator
MATMPAEHPAQRRRDATRTREALLEAARRRFSRQGYSSTTLREIADEAGVNVALIGRYFNSKEGLFAACLSQAVSEYRSSENPTSSRVPDVIAVMIAGFRSGGIRSDVLLLLLRSCSDEAAERIRLGFLQSFTERLATAGGWYPEHPDSQQLLLRAQMVLATSIGVAMLRENTPLGPLCSATVNDLVQPIRDLFNALLPPVEQ